MDVLSGSLYTAFDPDRRVVYAWFGGAGVNVYDTDGREVHHFTIGDGDGPGARPLALYRRPSKRRPTRAAVRAAINRAMAKVE